MSTILADDLEQQVTNAVERINKLVHSILELSGQNILIVVKSSTDSTDLVISNSKCLELTDMEDKDFNGLYQKIMSDDYDVLILENIDKISDQALKIKDLIRTTLKNKNASPLRNKRVICSCESIPGWLQTSLPDTCIIK